MPNLSRNMYVFGSFSLNARSRTLEHGGRSVALTPKAFEVLLLLIQHSGDVVSKDQLMRAVWPHSFVEESNLTQTVFMLRKALGETPQQRYILTVPGRGYRFVADVNRVSHIDDVARSSSIGTQLLETAPSTVPGEDASGSDRPCATSLHSEWAEGLQTSGRVRRALALTFVGVLLAFVGAGLVAYYHQSRSRGNAEGVRGRFMLAVLPFQNLTGDGAQEYFSDGLTEELITELGTLDPEHIGVIARSSVMHYKDTHASLDQVGRELSVEYVIEGSVRRDGNEVRVTAQLIQMKDQTHVWAREYDRKLNGLLMVQREIAREVADEIQLTFQDHPVSASQHALSPEEYQAYDLYLKGQYLLNKRTLPSFQRAIDSFEQAIVKDPANARAYAALADSYVLLAGYGTRPQGEFITKARAAALKALELDEHLPEAHTALALIVQNHDWDWQTSEKEFRRAIELNPNYATAHHWYAEHLAWLGRFDEALQEIERARQLDPLSLIVVADNGAILYYSRKYDRAIDKFRSVLEMDPNFSRAHLIESAYVEKRMFAEAISDIKTQRSQIPPAWYWSNLAYVYGRSGGTEEARHAIRELLRLSRTQPIDPRIIAFAYSSLGDKDQTIAWLEKAYEQHCNELISLKVNPAYDSLRGDPRFENLVRRVGLAE